MTAAEITVRQLTPELRDEYLAYFDTDAFANDPEWAGCYCYFPHADHDGKKWKVRASDENRAAAGSMVADGSMHGYLAFDGERAVGWCSANTRDRYTIFDPDDRDLTTVGVIACFVVAEAYRGKGVASALLAAAIDGFAAQGLVSAEAFPLPDADSAKANHFGPLRMYLAAGFEVVGEDGQNLVVRKQLARE